MKYEGDPYQVEYAAIQDVEIIREGTWNWDEHDRDMLEELVLTYDPALLRAKVIKDHMYWDEAFGHVLALRLEDVPGDKGVYRVIAKTGFLPAGKEMIESGKYNERSVGYAYFYPTEGFPYLWEFSLLGANTPAVSGMEPIVFKEEESREMMRRMAAEREQSKLSIETPDALLSWKRDDEYITYQVRNKSRFVGDLRKVELDKDEGIFAKVGQLKPEYVSEGGNPKSKVVQTILFDLQNGWTLAKAKAWAGERQLSAMEFVIASVVPYQNLSLADDEKEWDASAAKGRVKEWAGGDDINWDKYRQAFLWYDAENKETQGAYKLPIADIVDGSLEAVPRGIFAAAGAVSGARGGVDIPDADLPKVKTHLEKYYKKMDRKAPWQEDTSNESPEGVETIVVKTLTQGGTPAMTDVKEGEGNQGKTETPATREVVEAGSVQHLVEENIKLRKAKEQAETEAQKRAAEENAGLRKQVEIAQMESLRSRVRTLQADGYVVQPQIDLGLIEALALVPRSATVKDANGKERSAIDVIMDCLEYGGKLKLKLEVAKDIIMDNTSDPLARAEAEGIDTRVLRRQQEIMRADPKISMADAMDKASREVRGK